MLSKPWRLLCIAAVFLLGASACGSETTSAEPGQEGLTPTLALNLNIDSVGGQNLQLTTTDFTFTPQDVGGADAANEGYAHVSIDGGDPMRVYSAWVHLNMAPGGHDVRVALVANTGAEYDEAVSNTSITVPEPEPKPDGHSHSSDPIEFVGDAPEISVTATEDSSGGWNVHAEISNYRLAPEHASGENIDGEGHLHLYVNGVKIQRLYSNWWYIPELAGGENVITVEANANDHTPYAIDGEPIIARTTVIGNGQMPMENGEHDDHEGDDPDAEHDSHDMEDMGDTESAVVLDITYVDGEFVGVDGRIEVELGQTVKLSIQSDVAEHVHVHGYDMFLDVGPAASGELMFVANVPGVFEIEFEDSGLLLTELEVR